MGIDLMLFLRRLKDEGIHTVDYQYERWSNPLEFSQYQISGHSLTFRHPSIVGLGWAGWQPDSYWGVVVAVKKPLKSLRPVREDIPFSLVMRAKEDYVQGAPL